MKKVAHLDEDPANSVQPEGSVVARRFEIDCNVHDPLRIRELGLHDRDREVVLRDCWHAEAVDIAIKNGFVISLQVIM